MPRTWLVTGTSSGFGRSIAEAALQAGEQVVATARHPEQLQALADRWGHRVLLQRLDVTAEAQIPEAVVATERRFGGIDVLVNNAGYGSVGAVEETDPADVRRHFDVHVHGPLALIRAVLPGMRERGGGRIVNVSSFGDVVAYPGFGAYCATKFALEGASEALAAEVAPFGIRVLIVQPGAFRTGFGGGRMHRSRSLAAYEHTPAARTRQLVDAMDASQPGDPARAAAAILDVLDRDDAPLRLPLGGDAVDGIRGKLRDELDEVDRFEQLARATAFDDA